MPPDLNSLPISRSTSRSPLQSRQIYPTSPSPPHTHGAAHLGRTPSPSPRSSPVTLAAAATLNAADQRRSSLSSTSAAIPSSGAAGNSRGSPVTGRSAERRRSAVVMNLNLNDPALPGPGELSSSDHRSSIGYHFRTQSPGSIGGSPTIATGDPHHVGRHGWMGERERAPSLGEIHQELEQEQEAQVNRLLQMIRTQQAQLQALQIASHRDQVGSSPLPSTTSTAVDDSTPTSERSLSFPTPSQPLRHNSTTTTAVPAGPHRTSLNRSRPSSRTTSPALRPLSHPSPFSSTLDSHSPTQLTHPVNSSNNSSGDWPGSMAGLNLNLDSTPERRRSSRDEAAFYQAETQMLTRENQMLRLRIRELERMVLDTRGEEGRISSSPVTPSNLVSTPPIEADSQEYGVSGSAEEEGEKA